MNKNKALLAIFFVLILTIFSNAQTKNRTISEIINLRQKILTAIENRDRKMLEALYAENFTHTHASGKIDDRKMRLDVFVSGEKTIDTAPVEDLKISVFGDKTVIATGKSSVKNDSGISITYRWIVVYAKIGKKWQVAASQATKLSE